MSSYWSDHVDQTRMKGALHLICLKLLTSKEKTNSCHRAMLMNIAGETWRMLMLMLRWYSVSKPGDKWIVYWKPEEPF